MITSQPRLGSKTPPQTHAFLHVGTTSLLYEATLPNPGHVLWGHGRPKGKAKVCFRVRLSHKQFCWGRRGCNVCLIHAGLKGHSGFQFLEVGGSSGAPCSHFILNFQRIFHENHKLLLWYHNLKPTFHEQVGNSSRPSGSHSSHFFFPLSLPECLQMLVGKFLYWTSDGTMDQKSNRWIRMKSNESVEMP